MNSLDIATLPSFSIGTTQLGSSSSIRLSVKRFVFLGGVFSVVGSLGMRNNRVIKVWKGTLVMFGSW